MKAVGYYLPLTIENRDALQDIELPEPELRPRDLLVRVEAVSVNPVDVKVRASAAPPAGRARVLGFDAVGTVEAVGPEASLFRPGDKVFYAGSIDRQGTNAELHAVDERIVGRKPATLGAAESAAMPLTSITAWELLFDRLGVPYGSKEKAGAILIVNGAGGVGSILTQLARRLTGLTVIATASRPETVDWAQAMGAHHVIDHRQPLDEALKAIGIPEVQYVAGLAATQHHLPAIVRVLAPGGALALIDDPKVLDIVPLKQKSLSVHWEFMFARPLFATPDMIRQHHLLNEVSVLLDAGVLRTTLRETVGRIDAANLRAAHRLVEEGKGFGKIVLAGN